MRIVRSAQRGTGRGIAAAKCAVRGRTKPVSDVMPGSRSPRHRRAHQHPDGPSTATGARPATTTSACSTDQLCPAAEKTVRSIPLHPVKPACLDAAVIQPPNIMMNQNRPRAHARRERLSGEPQGRDRLWGLTQTSCFTLRGNGFWRSGAADRNDRGLGEQGETVDDLPSFMHRGMRVCLTLDPSRAKNSKAEAPCPSSVGCSSD